MSDADLEEIRKGRLAQLQQQQQGGPGGAAGSGGQDEQRNPRAAEARASILSQILQPEAADRLGRIRLVKESRATDVENRLIMLARSGQLRAKVTEEQLKELLGAVAENNEREGTSGGKIVISRRKGGWDDDDDLLDL
ncbi:MAG: hypothetical protein L6R39_000678 [Caloplaca ligustica]|nr:MAG: hypothetical protein L6R39_000678 [Caloplaca ligustica]